MIDNSKLFYCRLRQRWKPCITTYNDWQWDLNKLFLTKIFTMENILTNLTKLNSNSKRFVQNRFFHVTFSWFVNLNYLQVLCELQIAMLEKGITPDEDVNRTIMAPEIRDIQDDSYRNLRDWYIFRDYMNGLEYAVHAFKHLSSQHQVKRSSPSRPRLTSSWSYRQRRILRK